MKFYVPCAADVKILLGMQTDFDTGSKWDRFIRQDKLGINLELPSKSIAIFRPGPARGFVTFHYHLPGTRNLLEWGIVVTF